ncbi:MAG: PAP2 superfamily protein [Berkelbacteria bacterium GW2011_GWA2_46_7]|uniref:PAP2 superfamily protein n=1 Tax=Berkelbacteria bacterium GW2011_GWA2_46_7 TaxID=1618335 RepID=A0A0G1TE34_9BACT|nr:MAG: PAP2 superfamily protein [Berkelbacteria bacterium GW2011_GWA2_46_7]
MSQKLAKIVSLLTNPALVVSICVVTIVGRYADSIEKFWQGSLIGIGLLVVPGIIYSIYVWRKEGAVDLDLTERHDRIVPLMLSTLGAVIGSFIVQSKLQNATFTEMSYILVTMLAALTVITTVWKISLHAATIAGLSSLLVVYQGKWFVLGYLFLLPVVWSRLTLKQHSPNQLIAGTILGAGLTLVVAWFFSQYS